MSKKSLHEYYKRNFYDYKRPYKKIDGTKLTHKLTMAQYMAFRKGNKYLLVPVSPRRSAMVNAVNYYWLRKYYV